MSISGWGRYPVQACHVFRPEKRSEIATALDAGSNLPTFRADWDEATVTLR